MMLEYLYLPSILEVLLSHTIQPMQRKVGAIAAIVIGWRVLLIFCKKCMEIRPAPPLTKVVRYFTEATVDYE